MEPEQWLAETKRLLDHEKAEAAELKPPREELRDLEDTTLWVLLVDVMSRDTEKARRDLAFRAGHAKKKRCVAPASRVAQRGPPLP